MTNAPNKTDKNNIPRALQQKYYFQKQKRDKKKKKGGGGGAWRGVGVGNKVIKNIDHQVGYRMCSLIRQ